MVSGIPRFVWHLSRMQDPGVYVVFGDPNSYEPIKHFCGLCVPLLSAEMLE